ncbi:MAG: xanthine dehydrogenase family protein molybdopterin-binding subunit [Candidatus Cloacimonetes bacterium]|nr:xanthine dehydrogenase family protein molybdopterin-binding subunit [Candidatus Cloacimonadota bacterium]
MKSEPRKDALAKITGKCRFLDDYSCENMLHGYLLYATIDCGKIVNISFPNDYDLAEFTIVQTADIPGENIVPEPVSDQPFLADKAVCHYGQVIMGIAHADLQTLKKFISAIEVEYEEEEAIIDVHSCLDDKANQSGECMHISHTDRNKEKTDNLKHIEDVFYTQHQEQAYLEPQGMLAEYLPQSSTMKITGTMQCPFFVKSAVQMIMGKAVKNVIVETSEGIGGAFGGKEDFPNLLAGITALLAYKSQQPVKIVLERSDDILITTKRHPSRVAIVSYTNMLTGKLQAVNIDYRLDAGAYLTLSPVVLARGILHAGGGYCLPRCEISGYMHKSNTPPNGAFRGFGAPQALFAIEAHLDNIGKIIGKSPLEMRLANILRLHDTMPSSQSMKEDHLYECLQKVIEISDYKNKRLEFEQYNQNNEIKKGIGLALALHGGGYTGNGEKVLQSKVKLRLEKNGEVQIFVANVEMGQGAHTTLAQMVNEELDIPLEKVNVQIPNTSLTPNSGPTVASRTIYIVGTLLQKLAAQIKKEINYESLEEYIRQHQQLFPQEFERSFIPDPEDSFDEKTNEGTAYHDFSWAACVLEIEYDPLQYKIKVKKCWNVLDIGRVINYNIALGQVYGGITQALGWALTEDIYKKGYPRSKGFTDYTLPTTEDMPEFQVEFIHTDSAIAKGLGEIPMDYPAPAVRNAFLQATGIMINDLPLSPERIMKAINRSTL